MYIFSPSFHPTGPEEATPLHVPASSAAALKVPGITPNHLAFALNLHSKPPIHVPRDSQRNFSSPQAQHPKMPQSSTHDKMVQPLQSRQLYDAKDIKKEPLSSERGERQKGCNTEQQQSPRLSSFSTAAILSSSSSRTKPPGFEGFAQEFHQSVLRSTQEALANQRAAGKHFILRT